MDYKIFLEKLSNVYHFTQYGKLMPGIMHNMNGALTGIDSKLQITEIKFDKREKEIRKMYQDNEMIRDLLLQELENSRKLVANINKSKDSLLHIINNLSDKISTEISYQPIFNINDLIQNFHTFFLSYKYYKHNTNTVFKLSATKAPQADFKMGYFILYVLVKNAVEAAIENNNKAEVIISTFDKDKNVFMVIENNGREISKEQLVQNPFFSSKTSMNENINSYDNSTVYGEGLDLYILFEMIKNNPNIDIQINKNENGSGTIATVKFTTLSRK